MIKPPKNPEELYEFFMGIARPPVKSHVAYVNMINYTRKDWVINAHLDRRNRYSFWFYCKESDPARWYEIYETYETKE